MNPKMFLILTTLLVSLAIIPATFAETRQIAALSPEEEAVAEARFARLFTPLQTENAALSPDGRYLAYTLREANAVSVVVIDINNPGKAVSKVTLATDEGATPVTANTPTGPTHVPAQVRWLKWVTSSRLVAETNLNTARNLKIGFVSNWVNSPGSIVAMDADGGNARTLVTPLEVAEWLPDPTYGNSRLTDPDRLRILAPSQSSDDAALEHDPEVQRWRKDRATTGISMIQVLRSPRIVGLDATDPECVLLRCEGIQTPERLYSVEHYRLNVVTGILTSVADDMVPIGTVRMYDRTGRPRISIATSVRTPFPHRFTYNSEKLLKRWKPLDDVAAKTGPLSFTLSPDNYFEHRSVPIGFGDDPDVLYFASNEGRDTYGIYSLSLATGARSHITAENPVFDLFQPQPGVFPDDAKKLTNIRDDLFIDRFSDIGDPARTSIEAEANATGDSDAVQAPGGALIGAKLASGIVFNRIHRLARNEMMQGAQTDPILVFDRFRRKVIGLRFEAFTATARWFLPEWQAVQSSLEKLFPGRSVDIVEWDSEAKRFLVRIVGTVDPGAYYLFDSPTGRLLEFAERSKVLKREKLHQTTHYSFESGGRQVFGTLTYPRSARLVPVPLVVFCATQPWHRVHAEFNPELQAVAEMGFAVLQVNNRGAWGFGVKHRNAITTGYEEAQLQDILSSIDFLSRRFALNARRVAIMGSGHGGYVAIRALQLHPDRFRCAVGIDAMLDPSAWIAENRWTAADAAPALIQRFFGDAEHLKQSPLMKKTAAINKPVLLLNKRGDGAYVGKTALANAERLVKNLLSRDVPAELYELNDDFDAGLPQAKARVFRRVEDFINCYIYEYNVKLGELKQLD